ncbi:hypothetical protein LCGC14_2920330, partial [marine sediment metagenome]
FDADPEATILGETLSLITNYIKSQGTANTIVNKKDNNNENTRRTCK